MKELTLKKLTIENWRAQSKVIEFGNITEITGRNKEGKSTVMNAFLWLMTGYDEYDRSNYQLFDNTVEQTYENAVPASVEAVLEVNRNEYTFKKTAKQGWSRARGNSEYTRKGTDDYSFFADGIEVSATQYKTMIEGLLAPIDKLKIMLNIRYFLMLDWKDMRKQLEAMVGEIESSDFKGDYSVILQDLTKHTPDELKSLYKSKIKPIKSSIDSIPITIETMQNNLPDLKEVEEARKSIDDAKQQIADIDEKIVGAGDFAKPYIDKRNAELAEISKMKEDYANCEAAYNSKFDGEVLKITKEIRDVDSYNSDVDKQNEKALSDKENAKKELTKMNDLLTVLQNRHEELTEQNKECKARVFTGEKCSYCGQELPEDKLEEARKRFNEQKEKDHEYIVSQGKSNKEYLELTLKCIDNLKAEIEKPLEVREKKSKDDLEDKLDDLRKSFVPYNKTTEGAAKLSVIEEKRANLTVIPQQDNSSLLNMKRGLLDEIEINSKKLGLKDEYDKQVEKIKGLQEELKNNSVELAKLEGKLAKVKEYEEEKAKIISDRVNGKFEYVQIEMSETNKSGDIVPACVVKDNKGVNALVTNNASRVLCGIDIAIAFQNFYGLSLPLFIDNYELFSKDNQPDINRQEIRMIVDNCSFNVNIIE